MTPGPTTTPSQRRFAVENRLPRQGSIVIGLGSPNGDDQVGWLVADEISRTLRSAVLTRNLTNPVDLALAMEGMSRAVIIDAIRCDRVPGRPRRWEWPSPEIAQVRASGTHAIGLPESLRLAAELNRLPGEVVLWGIPGHSFLAGSPIEVALQKSVPGLAREIIERDLMPPPQDR